MLNIKKAFRSEKCGFISGAYNNLELRYDMLICHNNTIYISNALKKNKNETERKNMERKNNEIKTRATDTRNLLSDYDHEKIYYEFYESAERDFY